MSGPEYDAPPPEVPEEFADAYREAYRRALDAGSTAGGPPSEVPDVPSQPVVLAGMHRSGDEPPAPRSIGDWRRARWFLPGVIAASALVLVGAAYGLGMALSGDDDPAGGAASPSAARPTAPGRTSSRTAKPEPSAPSTAPGGWKGPVSRVDVTAVSADCTAPASNDSAGHRVTYVPENAIDDKAQTAWRCTGTAVGQELTLRLGRRVKVGEVGLVPGYAKTDAASGVDRYAENNRITRVRWTLGDGVSVVQRLDPDPSSRAVQLLRVPRTETDTITLEILGVKRGQRNTTAISEISLAAAGSA